MSYDWWISAALACFTLSGWMLIATMPFSVTAWPHKGIRGNWERAATFFAVASITRATITDHRTRWQIAAFLIAALVIEIGHSWTAGRSNGLMGWLASAGGAMVGALLLRHVAHTYDWHWSW